MNVSLLRACDKSRKTVSFNHTTFPASFPTNRNFTPNKYIPIRENDIGSYRARKRRRRVTELVSSSIFSIESLRMCMPTSWLTSGGISSTSLYVRSRFDIRTLLFWWRKEEETTSFSTFRTNKSRFVLLVVAAKEVVRQR